MTCALVTSNIPVYAAGDAQPGTAAEAAALSGAETDDEALVDQPAPTEAPAADDESPAEAESPTDTPASEDGTPAEDPTPTDTLSTWISAAAVSLKTAFLPGTTASILDT